MNKSATSATLNAPPKTATNKSISATSKSSKATVKSASATETLDDKSTTYENHEEELVLPEANPNCQCLGDCNCIRLKTELSVSDVDMPGICVDFKPQHWVLDFTPCEELDTEASVETCLKLWEMLAKVPQWAKALDSEASSPADDLSPRSEKEDLSEPLKPEQDHMAVSILNLMDKAGMTEPAFEVKEKAPFCDDDEHPDYFHVPKQVSLDQVHPRVSVQYNADGRRSMTLKKPKPKNNDSVKSMLNQLQDWDDDHPKSMEPPGHPPETVSMIQERRKKTFGTCDRDSNKGPVFDCKDCGCHDIEYRHDM